MTTKSASRAKESRNVSQISAVIDKLQSVVETMNIPKLEDAIREAHGKILALKETVADRDSEIRDLKNKIRDFESDVDDLVRVRRAITAGHASDAMFHVERVLSGADSAWRTRA